MVLLWYWSHTLSIGYHFGRTPTWELLCIVSVFWPFWGCSSPHASICQIDPSQEGKPRLHPHRASVGDQVPGTCRLLAMTCSAIVQLQEGDLAMSISAAGQPVMRREAMSCHVHCPIDQLTQLDLGRPANASNLPFRDLVTLFVMFVLIMLAPRSVGKTWVGRKARLVTYNLTDICIELLSLSPFFMPGMKCQLSISSLP